MTGTYSASVGDTMVRNASSVKVPTGPKKVYRGRSVTRVLLVCRLVDGCCIVVAGRVGGQFFLTAALRTVGTVVVLCLSALCTAAQRPGSHGHHHVTVLACAHRRYAVTSGTVANIALDFSRGEPSVKHI